MRVLNYKFTGLQNYEPIQKQMEALFTKAFLRKFSHFNYAVSEAVGNAAKYSVKGIVNAEIRIQVQISENNLTVKVMSETENFDAKAYQRQLRELAADQKYSKLDWGDYTGTSTMSRGFWFMLQAVDYLKVAEDGSYVLLSASIPYIERKLDTSISFLAPKFLVDSGGVSG